MNKKIIGILGFIVFTILISIIIIQVSTNNINDDNNQNTDNQIVDKEEDMNEKEFTSKININIDGKIFTATLEDNATTRAFLNILPLQVNMKELNNNEKYHYFDDTFPINPQRVGRINSGDIMLYGNNCLVVFYESFNTSYSYTKIGRIDDTSSLKESLGSKDIKIIFEKQ